MNSRVTLRTKKNQTEADRARFSYILPLKKQMFHIYGNIPEDEHKSILSDWLRKNRSGTTKARFPSIKMSGGNFFLFLGYKKNKKLQRVIVGLLVLLVHRCLEILPFETKFRQILLETVAQRGVSVQC